MLAVVALRHTTKEEGHGENIQDFSIGNDTDFLDFSDGNLLDSISFDDIFLDMEYGNDLPDLDMDSDPLADFSISTDEDESDPNTWVPIGQLVGDGSDKKNNEEDEEDKVSGSSSNNGEDIVTKRDNNNAGPKSSTKDSHERTRSKSSSQGKNSHAKRKVKVDWTPELHRRFVQAVEQLGVDKAVPSRILEIMGIDCLTRHNIASHLQKYRSHRKHLLAREAEAASWTQRRQMYAGTTGGGGVGKRELNPWHAPTMGFPPRPAMPPAQPPAHMHHFRPLHVWGHPSLDQSLVHMWPPKHLAHQASQLPRPPSWAPHSSSIDPSFWHAHHQRVANGLAQGAPCMPPPPLPTTRFAAPPVQVLPPPAMYKANSGIGFPAGNSSTQQAQFELHPSKESIDAAIEDVISKPWLPLPLGLKPPSLDGVLVELHRQGVSKIPPSASSSSSS